MAATTWRRRCDGSACGVKRAERVKERADASIGYRPSSRHDPTSQCRLPTLQGDDRAHTIAAAEPTASKGDRHDILRALPNPLIEETFQRRAG
jgi:hypothetical protein